MSNKTYQILVKDEAEADFVKEKYKKIVNSNLSGSDNIALDFSNRTTPKWIVLRHSGVKWYPYNAYTEEYITTSFDNLETTLENLKPKKNITTRIDGFDLRLSEDGLYVDGSSFLSYLGIDEIWKYVHPDCIEVDGFSISIAVEYVTVGCSTINYDTFMDIHGWVMENKPL